MNWRIAPIVLFAAFAAPAALAQQAKVFGTVTDAAGQPLEAVKLVLEPTADSGGVRAVSETKKKGAYLFGIVRPGTYVMKIELAGKAIQNLKARAVDKSKKEAWSLDGRPNPADPPKLELADGMDVTLDLVVGDPPPPAPPATPAPPAGEAKIDALLEQVRGGDCSGALGGLDTLISESPELARAHYLRGFCLATMERREEAIDSLGKALELNPAFEGAAIQRGELLAQLGRYPEAEKSILQELSNTQNPEILASAGVALGQVQAAQGKDADAIATFEKVLAQAPNRPEPYAELGSLYAKAGQNDKAKAILEQGKTSGAMNATAMLNLAISYWNKKDFTASKETLEQVLALPGVSKTDQAFAQGILGKILLRDGKTDAAIAAFKSSVELAPDGPLAQECREMLKALKK